MFNRIKSGALRAWKAVTRASATVKTVLGGAIAYVVGAPASQAAVDLTAAATAITDDLGDAQTLALPIFAIMFGIVLVLGFFKKATH